MMVKIQRADKVADFATCLGDSAGYAIANLRTSGLADVLAGHVVDVHYVVLIARAVAHQDHVPLAGVFELVERTARDQRRHAGLEHGQAAVREAHSAFAFEAGENLVLVVAMQVVMITWVGVVGTQACILRVFITTVRFFSRSAISFGSMI
jgi:hypothetical protein